MVLLVFSAMAQNCNYSLYGTIRDNKNQALPAATVTLLNNNKVALADIDGHFHFNNLCAGDYILSISYVGFSNQEVKISLSKNQEIEISLNSSTKDLTEVNIISSANSFKPLQTNSKLNGNSLELSRGESLGESLKRLPGLNSIQTGPAISKPVIHGMHSNRVVIYNSGVRLEGQQWGSEHAPEVDPFLANEITVVKGAASIQYAPDALGGVILVEPEGLNFHRRISGNINLVGAGNNGQGTVSANLDGATKNENFAWRVQSTLKRAGNAKTPDYYLNNTGFKEINGAFTLAYKKKNIEAELFFSTFNTTVGIFEGAHIGNLENLYAVFENGRPFTEGSFNYSIDAPKQEVSHNLIKLKAKKFFANNSTLSANYSFQNNHRQEFDIRRAGRTSIAALDLVLIAQNLEVLYETANSNNLHTKYGINTSIVVNNNVPGTFATPLIPNYDSFNPSIFLIKRLEKNSYELEAGIRYDYKFLDAAGYNKDHKLYGDKHDFHNVSGSLGGLLKLNTLLNLRSNLGLSWRAPSVNELYSDGLHHGSASIEIGDSSLKSEKGYKWINTLALNADKFSFELSLYGNYVNDYIFLEPTGEFQESLRGAFPVFNYDQTNALFFGSDLFANYKFLKNLNWYFKGSLIRTKDSKNNSYLPMIPADKIDNSIRWTIPAKNKKISNPFIELQHVFVARQNRFDLSKEFIPPPAAYNLFNFSAGLNHKIGDQNLGINASVFNLFNTNYKDYLNRFRYYAHETGRNFVIRLNYKF